MGWGKLFKIEGYRGLYFKDAQSAFASSDKGKLTTKELEKVLGKNRKTDISTFTLRYMADGAAIMEDVTINLNALEFEGRSAAYIVRRIDAKLQEQKAQAKTGVKVTAAKVKLESIFYDMLGTIKGDTECGADRKRTYKREREISTDNRKIQKFFFDKWIRPKLGARNIGTIKREEVEAIIEELRREGKAARTQKLVIDYLRPVFLTALRLQIIKQNPIDGLSVAVDNAKHFEIRPNDARRVYDAVMAWQNLQQKVFFLFAITGRRQSEITRLRCSHIDLEHAQYTLEGAKNTKTRRDLLFPIPKDALEPLKELLALRDSGDFLFKGNTGAIKKNAVSKWFAPLSKAAEVEMTMHECRNMLGHILKADGMGEGEIGAFLGHSSQSVTGRYSYLGVEIMREWLERYFDILRGDAEPRGAKK